jgi:hypothetical protein
MNNKPNIQINESVECSKYTLDGNQACSIVYFRPNENIASLTLVSAIGEDLYVLGYNAPPDNFDNSLPIAEHMINSFKFGPEAANP